MNTSLVLKSNQKQRKQSKRGIYKIKNILWDLIISIRVQTYIMYGVFFLISFFLVMLVNKFTLHTITNKFHSSFFDVFFKYATHIGDGVMFGVLVLVFLSVKRKMALVFLVGGILTLLVTHLLKKVVFKGIARPVGALGEDVLHLVDGVKIALWNSFPSGHTITAFTIFTILSLYFTKCKSQYLWFSLAIIAALSRVYLSQHFLIDVFVGSFIGILIGFLSMAIFNKPKTIH
ncbi:phosphatase PAP2 family protein [Tenacibaculum xiamenense]|uniref:phosphatase PAP2 family protein n=1 Tax=Tenacibaculum xiamenense TaxID=1261553 RepID=UPI003893BC55